MIKKVFKTLALVSLLGVGACQSEGTGVLHPATQKITGMWSYDGGTANFSEDGILEVSEGRGLVGAYSPKGADSILILEIYDNNTGDQYTYKGQPSWYMIYHPSDNGMVVKGFPLHEDSTIELYR